MVPPKFSKKELKEDEFLGTFDRIIGHITQHTRGVMMILAGLALVIIAFSAIHILLERNEAKARHALYLANRAYKENLSLISEDSALERKGTPDFEQPLKLYQEVIKLFPRSESAEEALFQSAQCLCHLSRYDEAISAFQKYLQHNRKGQLSVLAGLGLGFCYEQKSKFDKASEAYSATIANNPNDPLLGEAYVSLGRCQDAMGKREEASRTFDQVVEKFPNTNWKAYAERKLLYLKSH